MGTASEEAYAHEKAPPADILLQADLPSPGRWLFFAVLGQRNYRLFFSGQLVSQLGNWINNVAQAWLVYGLTHSPFMLGLTAFVGQVPVFFFSSLGGVIADRFDRRAILIVTQALSIVESAGLAVLVFSGAIRPWHVVVLALFQGLVNAVDIPTRHAMIIEMVGKENLRHAISLNSIMFNFARLVAPPVAGLIIGTAGTGYCFAIDALSYGALLAGLFRMRLLTRPLHQAQHPLHELKAGLLYVLRQRQLRDCILLIAVCSAFGASYVAFLPAFAGDVLHRGSEGLGLLYGAVGAGALIGAYVLVRVPNRHLAATPILAAALFGASLMAFSWSHWFDISAALLLPASFSLMLLGGSTSTLIQTIARDDMRGRVVALYAMAFMGMMPWGSLVMGWVAGHTGVVKPVAFGGGVCILAAMATWHNRRGSRKFPMGVSSGIRSQE